MRTTIFFQSRATLLILYIFTSAFLYGQQNIIQDKDNTRPEITRQWNAPPMIGSFIAAQHNGYNEIQWTAKLEADTRKFIVEYSTDGIHFQSAGEALSTTGQYLFKHQTFEILPLLYRLRIEDLAGRYTYSQHILLQSVEISPVKIYPTIITGNTVNIIADFPLERINVIAANGQQVFTKEIGGKDQSITLVLPSLGKGVYWVHCLGRGWKTTSQLIVP